MRVDYILAELETLLRHIHLDSYLIKFLQPYACYKSDVGVGAEDLLFFVVVKLSESNDRELSEDDLTVILFKLYRGRRQQFL